MGQHQEEQLCQILLGNRWHRDSQDCPQLVFFFHSLEPPGTAGRLGRVSQRVQSTGEDLAALAWEVLEGRTGHPHCHRPLPTEQGVGAVLRVPGVLPGFPLFIPSTHGFLMMQWKQ